MSLPLKAFSASGRFMVMSITPSVVSVVTVAIGVPSSQRDLLWSGNLSAFTSGGAVIEIYHVPGTRGIRPIWTCEELGLEYRVIPVDFSAEYRASDEWRRMNPVGKVPVLTDGD